MQAAAEARPVLREAAYQANIALQEPYMIPKSMHHSGCGPSTVPEQQDVMTNYPAVHDAVCQTSPADEPQVVRLQAASSAEDTCQPAPKAVIEKVVCSTILLQHMSDWHLFNFGSQRKLSGSMATNILFVNPSQHA